MITRLLPRAEWSDRLIGTDLAAAVTYLPADAQVLIVEDAGQILGCWAAMSYVHLEGLWIHPDHRGKASVGRRLLSGMRHVARALGVGVVLTAATDDRVRDLIRQVGGVELPGTHHVIPIGGA